MKKIIQLEGLNCGHCVAKATKALNAIDGVAADVNLKTQQAIVKLSKDVVDQVLIDAIEQAGYKVISVAEKKGLFR